MSSTEKFKTENRNSIKSSQNCKVLSFPLQEVLVVLLNTQNNEKMPSLQAASCLNMYGNAMTKSL